MRNEPEPDDDMDDDDPESTPLAPDPDAVQKRRKPSTRAEREGMPGLTVLEMELRLDAMAEEIASGKNRRELIEHAKLTWKVDDAQAKRYIHAATKRLTAIARRPPAEWRGKQIARYLYIAKTASKPADRIKALERVDRLLGLETAVPKHVTTEHTGAGGKQLPAPTVNIVNGIDLAKKLREYRDVLAPPTVETTAHEKTTGGTRGHGDGADVQ